MQSGEAPRSLVIREVSGAVLVLHPLLQRGISPHSYAPVSTQSELRDHPVYETGGPCRRLPLPRGQQEPREDQLTRGSLTQGHFCSELCR